MTEDTDLRENHGSLLAQAMNTRNTQWSGSGSNEARTSLVFHVSKKRHNKKDNMLKALLLSLMNLAARAIPLAYAAALAAMATAQTNLVPNPSFEDTVDCEVSLQCDLLRAVGWYNPNTATPDVYDCDLSRNCGQPMDPANLGIQNKGFQYAQDGSRHAGGFQWYGPGSSYTRDYLMTELTDELLAGLTYEVGLHYSRAEGYAYAVDRISAYLGPMPVFEDHPNNLITVIPQVHLMAPDSSYLAEGNEWVQLVDTFVAQGGERWLVIGTFLGPDEVNGVVATEGTSNSYAYYYFDQVSVRLIEAPHAISESGVEMFWSLNDLSMTSSMGAVDMRLRIFDAAGRLVRTWAGRVTDRKDISTAGLEQGTYVALAESKDCRQVVRFIKGE